MDSLTTHPSTAQQATAFTGPASLSFPGGAGDLTPPSEKDGHSQANGVSGQTNGADGQAYGGNATTNGNGVTPTTPAATPGAGQGVSGIVPTLQNIVATVNLDCRLDLKTIALHARNAEYNPKRFAAVIMRIREPKTTALIFASGKMVVTGAKSEDDSKLASRKYARIIQKLGFNAKFTDFKIQNIVGSCDIKFPIRLEGLASRHHNFSSYEPELFPGLIYRMIKPKIVLLIFVSGKIVLTGAKVREEIYQAFEMIYPVLQVSTTLALLTSPVYARTHITLVDPNIPDTANRTSDDKTVYTPNPNATSIDSSRIIRPDYANPAYSKLAAEAQELWRKGYGGKDVYQESGLIVTAGKEGSRYVEAACRNVEDTSSSSYNGKAKSSVQRLNNLEEIRAAAGLEPTTTTTISQSAADDEEEEIEGSLGQTGYINRTSGWANAEGAIRTVMARITAFGSSRIVFKRAKVKELLFSASSSPPNETHGDGKVSTNVSGVVLNDETTLEADLTILTTGAWTGSLVDLRGRIKATAQVVAYVPLTAAEAARLAKLPVLLNLSTGYFAIPPARNADAPSSLLSASTPITRVDASSSSEKGGRGGGRGRDGEEKQEGGGRGGYTYHLKIARHAHGYLNPTPITLRTSAHSTTRFTTSLPSTTPHKLPPAAVRGLRDFLTNLLTPNSPSNPNHTNTIATRPFTSTRLCHYADTPTGDFLITYHPHHANLFLATGGSGHGLKFLPVLGGKIVEILAGGGRGGGMWGEVWGWKKDAEVGRDEGSWAGDGSRGGSRGEVLVEAMGEREREGREKAKL
ncbi:MAG: hypothetical protein L6R37_000564 [Teloschistes peruensis]|nr:MAG: hypothetical protein L6R37_000564 [Teloschistes peruensis]